MSERKSNFRLQHVSKTPEEHAAYRKFLREYRYLEKTEEKPSGADQTTESSFEDEGNDSPNLGVTPKSLKLRIGDFFGNNWTVSIVGGFLVFVLCGFWILSSNVNAQNVKIDNIKNSVDGLIEDNKTSTQQNNDINIDFKVFKAKIEKDIEYIKSNFNLSRE